LLRYQLEKLLEESGGPRLERGIGYHYIHDDEIELRKELERIKLNENKLE
jgi:hypothetical protein